jgi:hypothetical protein
LLALRNIVPKNGASILLKREPDRPHEGPNGARKIEAAEADGGPTEFESPASPWAA